MAAGQAAGCLHTMAVLQAYQAELLGDSSESLSQLPPGNVAALRGSLPLKVCPEQLDQPSPAGYPEDWFLTIDLKDAYFHIFILPQHRKFLRFAFRGKAYQYRVLPFGLALSPRTFMKCVDAALAPLRLQDIRILDYIDNWLILAQSEILAHMKDLGLRLNAKESVLHPVQRTTYLWDSTTMQARLSPARIESILMTVARVREGQSLTVKLFQKLLGLMAAASNVITFGLLHMRPL